jgi:hypothetical protein
MRKVLASLALLIVLAGVAAAIYWQRATAAMDTAGPHAQPL